jgi:hypothetical protein
MRRITKNVSVTIGQLVVFKLIIYRFSRLCQRAIQVCHETYGKLCRALCRSGSVSGHLADQAGILTLHIVTQFLPMAANFAGYRSHGIRHVGRARG